MVYKNSFLFSLNNCKKDKGQKALKSNQEVETSYDNKDESEILKKTFKDEKLNVSGLRASVPSTSIFKKNMFERNVKRELFIIESEDNFEALSLKGKILQVIKKGDESIKDWFYDKGSSGKLETTWEMFVESFISFCCSQNIESIEKYAEETWFDFINRLKLISTQLNISESEVLKKLRTIRAPKTLQSIFFSFNGNLAEMLERVIEWEEIGKKFYNKKDYYYGNNRTYDKQKDLKIKPKEEKKIICYKCNKIGHYSSSCKDITPSSNNIKSLDNEDLDRRVILLNGQKVSAIFDSGACESIITSGMLKNLPNNETYKVKKEFTLINGQKININKCLDASIEYNNLKVRERLYVIQNDEHLQILLSNKFIKNSNKPHMIPIECIIDTGNNRAISWTRPIRSIKDKEDFSKLIEKLEQDGIIEESSSHWLNPVQLVRKKNGDLRFCVDFRRLNDLVQQDNFEIPKIQELITVLHNKKYFTKIDLKDGFWHIPIREQDKAKTAFFSGSKLMQFTRMPQGFKNSPAIFQRAINYVLKDLLNKICIAYIDDILVFGETEEEHDVNLGKVLEKLKEFSLNENKEKRMEKKEKIIFLGYEISFNKISPTLNRAQGIVDFKQPESKKELQRFLGIINYDRLFVKNLSAILKPFYELLKLESKFIWNNELNLLFNNIKKMWEKNLHLYIPNPESSFALETDASDTGLGAVLKQENKIVAYISRTLNSAERNYSTNEKETLAALWAMEKFRNYLFGRKFKLYTDHQALIKIRNKSDYGSARVQRWLERLSEFQFEVEYTPGNLNVSADALSRSLNMVLSKKKEAQIKNIHLKSNHQKNIIHEVRKAGILISENKLNNLLDNCKSCMKMNKKHYRSAKFINTFFQERG